MGTAQDMNGNKFMVPSVVHIPEISFTSHNTAQKITVTKTLRRGQVWDDTKEFEPIGGFGPNQDILSLKKWKIVGVKNIDDKTKKIMFKFHKEKKLGLGIKHYDDPKYYKELLQELNLSKEVITDMIRDLLLNVFTPRMLTKLLKADKLEFILDECWMYLKCGDTAFRV